MKGLILKDLLLLKKTGRIFLVLFILYVGMGVFTHTDFGVIVAFITGMLSLTCFAYDEQAKWLPYALTMPVTRKTIVQSKFVMAMLLGTGGTLTGFLMSILAKIGQGPVDFSAILLRSGLALCAILLFSSLALPLMFKLGAEKSRIVLLICYTVPIVGITALIGWLEGSLATLPDVHALARMAAVLTPLVTLCAMGLSYCISMAIFKSKDL